MRLTISELLNQSFSQISKNLQTYIKYLAIFYLLGLPATILGQLGQNEKSNDMVFMQVVVTVLFLVPDFMTVSFFMKNGEFFDLPKRSVSLSESFQDAISFFLYSLYYTFLSLVGFILIPIILVLFLLRYFFRNLPKLNFFFVTDYLAPYLAILVDETQESYFALSRKCAAKRPMISWVLIWTGYIIGAILMIVELTTMSFQILPLTLGITLVASIFRVFTLVLTRNFISATSGV